MSIPAPQPVKPLSEMTDDEVLEYIDLLRKQRAERREAILTARATQKAPKASAAPKPPKLAKNEVDEITANILRNIMGDDIKK
jgi:hypothetical protein